MKCSIEWRKNFKYLDQVDQYNIDYKPKLRELISFLDSYKESNKRINIRLQKGYSHEDIDILISLYKEKNYNIVIIFPEYDAHFVAVTREKGVPFYLLTPAANWDVFLGFISLGVSDIFVSEALAFDLEQVSKVAKEHNIQLRCYANVCQSAWPNDCLKSFFIRPENIDDYSKYIDVVEFWKSVDRQDIYYKIYFIDKKWDGNLGEIIKGFDRPLNNYYIVDDKEFAERRMVCQKKCLREDKRCQHCIIAQHLAKTLEQSKDYQVFRKRK